MHLLCLAAMNRRKISYNLSVSVFFKLSSFFEGAKIRMSLVDYPTKQKKVSCLAWLTKRTWQDDDDYEIIEEGFKRGHGYYYMCVFTLHKVIGTDPWGFATKKICIYYAWRPWIDGRFHIISAYPYSSSYHHFLKARKYGYLS